MNWKDVERPGYLGKRRSEAYEHWNDLFGRGNWRISWKWLGEDIDFEFACTLYEDAYFQDFFERQDLWMELSKKARNVYDIDESDVISGFDYKIQLGRATHIQDIAIRRVMARRGIRFEGSELVQIRGHSNYWGQQLSPGKVKFHIRENIIPGLEEDLRTTGKMSKIWWDIGSVEDFYQSNKYLQARAS